MIETYYSNSYEFLRELMGRMICSRRREKSSGVFARDHILVPSAAVADDLNMYFARSLGVATGLWFDFVGRWLERFTQRTGSAQGTFMDDLDWMVLALINDEAFLNRPGCERLKHYVTGQTPVAKCTFAQRLSRLFTTYTTYRLDWVIEWMGNNPEDFCIGDTARRRAEQKVLEAHPDSAWQRAIWYEIKHRLWGKEKREWPGSSLLEGIPASWQALLKKKESPGRRPQLFIFLPSGLPPLALPMLQGLSSTQDIFIFCLNPSAAYWFEALPKAVFSNWKQAGESALGYLRRNASSERAQIERLWNFTRDPETGAEPVLYEDDCEPVQTVERPGWRCSSDELELMGGSAPNSTKAPEAPDLRLDVSRLLELRASDAGGQQQFMVYVNQPETTALGALQQAILEDDAGKLPRGREEGDQSITFVKAASAAREVEGLADWIQSLIARTKKSAQPLTAEDILVVTPDINALAPVISAVLDNRMGRDAIAYSIVGQSMGEVNSAAQAILAAGRLLTGRADRRSFEELLQYPVATAGRGARGIDLEAISSWLASAGYRFGLNEGHVKCLVDAGLAAEEGKNLSAYDGTLSRALERLTLGSFSRGDLERTNRDVYAARGDELGGYSRVDTTEGAAMLSFLLGFWEDLVGLLPGTEERSAAQWQAWTHAVIERLFPEAAASDEVEDFRRIVDAMAEGMVRVLGDAAVDFETFWTMLSLKVVDGTTPVRSTGRVVFAPIEAFRWLPRRAVAVLGLNEGPQFPGVNRTEEFDLMQAELRVAADDGSTQTISTRRRGDRDSRANNRNVFFDLIVSAREYLYCSYTIGTDPVEKNPSVVLADLKQTLALGLGDEAAVDAAFGVTLATQSASPESFAPHMGLLQSHDAAAARAVNEAERVNYLAADARFVDQAVVTDALDAANAAGAAAPTRTLSFKELSDCLLKPDRWLVKTAGVSEIKVEPNPDVTLESLFDNGLLKKIASSEILGLMQDAETVPAADIDRNIISTLKVMPGMGLAPVRELRARREVAHLRAGLSQALDALNAGQAARVQREALDDFVTTGARLFARVKFSPQTIYKTPAGDFILFFDISSTDPLRSLLRFISFSAVRPTLGAVVVNLKAGKKTKKKGDEVPASSDFDPAEGIALSVLRPASVVGVAAQCREVLDALVSVFERQALESPALATPDEKTFNRGPEPVKLHNGAPVWLGRDEREAMQEGTEKLQKAIENLRSIFETSEDYLLSAGGAAATEGASDAAATESVTAGKKKTRTAAKTRKTTKKVASPEELFGALKKAIRDLEVCRAQ